MYHLDEATARCEQLIETLPLQRPFVLEQFLATLAEQRGKRIELISSNLGIESPCGMLISTVEADYIYCGTTLSPLHQQHTVMHEVGHLLFDHCAGVGCGDTPTLAGGDALAMLMPTLSPELVRRVLGRSLHRCSHEREAELFASLVLARVSGSGETSAAGVPADCPTAPDLAMLNSAFGPTARSVPRGD
ncbi:hypothetical protein [Amycolatopsis magusensis]|uniref:hypothetical protein n=1 Tax=Amycolatopsis magusensis TaxID=882444 RepID=UPI00379F15F3